jgi:hypothetical protein
MTPPSNKDGDAAQFHLLLAEYDASEGYPESYETCG